MTYEAEAVTARLHDRLDELVRELATARDSLVSANHALAEANTSAAAVAKVTERSHAALLRARMVLAGVPETRAVTEALRMVNEALGEPVGRPRGAPSMNWLDTKHDSTRR